MPDLRAFLEETFETAGGELSFEDFMALALYDPAHGYYTASIHDVGGERGDFATAPTLTPALGRAMARWLREERNRRGWRGRVDVIEVGGGSGALAEAVLRSLGWRGRRRFRYRLVEISPVLRARQRERLRRFRGVCWHDDAVETLGAAGGRALIFSNELIDAFPAKWLRWDASGGRWREIAVRFDRENGLREAFRDPPADLDLADFSAAARTDRPDGQRIEIQPTVRDWLERLAGAWHSGSMLTIDYGGEVDEVHHRRPGGTLRGYWRNERVEGGGIYRRFGKQDLTLDVNFTDLRSWGRRFGFEEVGCETQRAFLERFGEGGDAMADSAAGEAFRVLEQRRD